MTFDPQDPRWTKWVLEPDSLTVDEQKELGKLAAENPDCQRLIVELKAASAAFGQVLRGDAITPANAAAMESAVKAHAAKLKPSQAIPTQREARRGFGWAELATIAVFLIIFGALLWPARQSARESSRSIADHSPERLPPAVQSNQLPAYRAQSSPSDDAIEALDESVGDTAELDKYVQQPAADPQPLSTDFAAAAPSAANGGSNAPRSRSRSATPSPVAAEGEIRRYEWEAPQDLYDDLPLKRPVEQLAAAGRAGEAKHEPTPYADLAVRGTDPHWGWEATRSNTETYPSLVENRFIKPDGIAALSTFSIDVDTASYANARRFLRQTMLPPTDAVRIEELVNYFRYDYAPPTGEHPFAVHVEMAACPWEPKHQLARIALKGKVIEQDQRPASNLVFLLDVSGSMNEPNKLPLVKDALRMLVEQLSENDRVAIAVYAGSSGLVLDSTTGDRKEVILAAIDSLQPSGSTNGAAGITLAYEAAVKGFITKGTNRVILCTDGDFNVGTTSDDELVKLITEKAQTGVFLSVLGFGMGNYKDAKMLQLADKGNGNYAYIDNQREARKVLVEQMSGTLVTIAKDVKIQVEFNPQKVAAYRLIGYEKRMLQAEDFKDDTKDAGEIGAGHTVTALYELVPNSAANAVRPIDDLVFQKSPHPKVAKEVDTDDRSFVVKLRYKQPDGDKSQELQVGMNDGGKSFAAASKDFQFASAVASFGMLLRNSEFKGNSNLDAVAEIAASAEGKDEHGYRAEFVELVRQAKRLQVQQPSNPGVKSE